MESKVKNLENKIRYIQIEDLDNKDYIELGFTEAESKKCCEIIDLIQGIGTIKDDLALISFAQCIVDITSSAKLKYYYGGFICQYTKVDKYKKCKEYIDYIISNTQDIFKSESEIYLEKIVLINLLIISSTMNIELNKILTIVLEYVDNNKNITGFIGVISHALNKLSNEDIAEKFKSLYIEIIDMYIKADEGLVLECLLDEVHKEKNKYFDIEYLQNRLYLLYLELGKERCGIREITYLQKAVSGFRMLKNNTLEKKALGILEKAIKDNAIDWKKQTIQLPDEIDRKLKNNIKNLKEYLKQNTITKVIRNIDKYLLVNSTDIRGRLVKQELIYEPFPRCESISEFRSNAIFSQLCTNVTLQGNRISKLGWDDKSMYKNIAYEINRICCLFPTMNWLYSNNVNLLKEIRSLIKECKYIDEELYNYYLKLEPYYAKEKAFEFITISVIFIEKLMRAIYIELMGTSIVSQKRNPQIQFNINLQEIMKEKEVKMFLGDDLYAYLEYALIDDDGLNLRNNSLHGLLGLEAYNHSASQILMHIILILVNKGVKVENNEELKEI